MACGMEAMHFYEFNIHLYICEYFWFAKVMQQ